ncbi:MAG: spondin domain-containing protein [Bacteroidota bacterium]|nr:spondin domain-containing protein [Bacteroidota bacterium]
MKFIYTTVILSLLLFSCNKYETNVTAISEARYEITITGKWTSPNFTVPGGAHYTVFAGMVHNTQASMWKAGSNASPGTELLAENGNATILLNEVDSMIKTKNASALIFFLPPAINNGLGKSGIYCNNNYSVVSFASMLGPTPDWFVGISGLNLYNGIQWVSDTTINLYAYDAGTEEGDVLGYNNPASMPQQTIHLLEASRATALANGNPILAPIATVRFTRQ